MQPVICLRNVHVLFGTLCALDVESLEIGPGERVFLLGHSGAGKTTLSRLIKGRLHPSSGTVRVLGCDPATIDPARSRSIQRRTAMIDQEFFLVPRLSVVSNVLHGCLGRAPRWRSLLGWYTPAEWEKAEDILQEVGLDGLGNRRVDTLSGGQRQRAAIARAFMQEAEIILADEPISNLDPQLAEEALDLLVECASRRGVTLVVNLHQPALAKRFASRLIGFASGKMVYDGPPDGFTDQDAEKVYRGSPRQPSPTEQGSHDPTSKDLEKKPTPPNIRLVRR